jgi:hypothetical protein
MTSVRMSARAGSAAPSVVVTTSVSAVPAARTNSTGVALAQQLERLAQLVRPRLGGGIVERDHEIGLGGSRQPALNGGPGFQIIRERDRAEIAAQRRADLGRRGQHRRHAGLDPDVEIAPGRIAGFDRLEHRRRHGEHTGIAARHHGDLTTRGGERERQSCAVEFDAIVRRVAALVVARGNAVEIGAVAHEIGGTSQRRPRCRRHQLGLAGPGADHHQRAVHSRLPSPGISTMAK